MKCEWITADSPAWATALRRTKHDFYHLADYCRLSAESDGGTAIALVVESGSHLFFLPLVQRTVPEHADLFDVTSPYGYPGPVLSTGASQSFLLSAFQTALEMLRERGCIALFLRMHPLLNSGIPPLPGGQLQAHGETVVIDLRCTPEEMWKQTRSGHRNEINRALRAGHTFTLDPEWKSIERVAELYLQTMQRVGATDYYLFKLPYFERLRDALGPHGMLATVEIENVIAAGAVFTVCDGLAQYHLSGSDADFRKQQPTKLLLHQTRLHGHHAGWHSLHLGGGAGASEDSLFRFKAGFSAGRARFQSWRAVLNESEYLRCCSERGLSWAGELDGYFPLYRSPS